MNDPNPYASPQSDPEPAESFDQPDVDSRLIATRWIAAAAFLALVSGVASRLVRPLFTGPVHYDALIGVALLVVLSAVLLTRFWLLPLRTGAVALQVGVAACWVAFAIGWTAANGEFWEDMIGVAFVLWLSCAAAGGVAFAIRALGQPARPRNDG